MTINKPSHPQSSSHWTIWLVGVSFVLFQFFLQLSSGVVMDDIMHDMKLSALITGLLSSSFYIIYTGLQIPVGILFDFKDTRFLLASNALLCSIGCLVFASSHHLLGLFLGRSLIGFGAAFAFIGLSHVLREYFPLKQFGFMIGLSETLGFFATALGIIGLGAMINRWGWREFINIAGIVGFLIAFMCWKYIPSNRPKTLSSPHYGRQILQIIRQGKAWVNGFFVGLTFSVVTVFGALWAEPFIQVKLECGLRQASLITAIFFVGTALSCPLFGLLSARFSNRKRIILSSTVSTTLLFMALLYYPTHSYALISLLMFLIGLCCGAYILAYTIANELAPSHSRSTSTGFTNTLALISTPLLQPLIGFLLDCLSNTGTYSLSNYQIALLTIPASLVIACVLVCFLPETKSP